ncbi:MAG TPA: hypothetical protein VM940_06110 [Chthoniobacterales bacterium]|jgi:hypothetical protein|nr:hypothetical protein [Chthoniobacterales bacterium]
MLRISATLACLLFLAQGARAQIDFTPTIEKYMSYGAEFSTVNFKNDKRSVSMEVPRKWACRGDATRLQFTPPEQNFAEGVVQAAPPTRTRVLDDATLKALEAQVIDSLPPGSQGIKVLTRMENPLIVDQSVSCEFIVSYQALGQTFQRCVTFLNCPDAQIIFRFTAPKATFDNLNSAFRRSVASWRVVEPPGAAPMTAAK